MAEKARFLFICRSPEQADQIQRKMADSYDCEIMTNAAAGLERLGHECFDGVFISSDQLDASFEPCQVLQTQQILRGMPDGVLLLDANNKILWANDRVKTWTGRNDPVGESFYAVLDNPEILGPDFCPFHTALATGNPGVSTVRTESNRFFEVHATPVRMGSGRPEHLIVSVHDVTSERVQQQKLAAIHQAGRELADLLPDELFNMSVNERVELLKSNILYFTRDLLNFEVVEIRLLDAKTGRLEPLLAVGMAEAAIHRELYARPQDNGITGFVAATGKSYLCEDASQDPLYLKGAHDARSSLTVPLLWHDEVIGTFNVESPEAGAFTESDLQFLEIFTRDVAAALNTLELLVAEKAGTAVASVEAIHSAVALPVDEILNDAVHVMERYIGHEPEVVKTVQRILRNARDIKQVIQSVGQRMAPVQAKPLPAPVEEYPRLKGCRVLLVDENADVRSAAHDLLDRYGCIVETAPTGSQATLMIRNMLQEGGYDVVIADIRLPDMSGYQFMLQFKEIVPDDPLPLVLMTGFGYDPGHSLVKARQAGLKAVLYKPFRLDMLIDTVEQVLSLKEANVEQEA